jgi:hypothetical protein
VPVVLHYDSIPSILRAAIQRNVYRWDFIGYVKFEQPHFLSVVCLKTYKIRQNISRPLHFLQAIGYTFRFTTMPKYLMVSYFVTQPREVKISIFLHRYAFLRNGCGWYYCATIASPTWKSRFASPPHISTGSSVHT